MNGPVAETDGKPPLASPSSVRVLLFDPSPLSRSCLTAGFGDVPEVAVTACGDLKDLEEASSRTPRPDIVAVHAVGQNVASPEFEKQLQILMRTFPDAARMLLSGPDDGDQMMAGLRLGFSAYVTDGVGLSPTLGVMRLIREGMVVYPGSFLYHFKARAEGITSVGQTEAERLRQGGDLLTPRQMDVLRLLARGLSNKAIATELNISESTVKVHIRAIMERTGMLNLTQIVAHFFGGKGNRT